MYDTSSPVGSPPSSDSVSTAFKVKRFEMPIHDFDRARLFYVEALGLQSWDADYPIPATDEIMLYHAITGWKKPKGYFVKIPDEERAALILIGMRRHVGYERVIFVLDVEEVKKKILAAGGQLFDTTELEPPYSPRRKGGGSRVLFPRTMFQDTEGNIIQLRSWTFG